MGLAVGLAAAIPAAYLLVVVADDASSATETLFTARSADLAFQTIALTAAVSATAVGIGVPLAWLTTRTDLPGRRLWETLTTLPLVIPSYIGAYLLISTLGPVGLLSDILGVERIPSIYGFAGAWLALSLFTYPLVLLTVRGTLLRLDPQLEDAARAMGRSRFETFTSVVLPQLVPAVAMGALLVALYVVSDFGAVSIMRFDSLSREIYVTYQTSFDRSSAASLGLLLVLIALVLLILQSRLRGASGYHRVGPGAARVPRPVPLRRWRIPALIFCTVITLIALVIPLAVLVYWAAAGLGGEGLAAGDLIANGSNSLLAAAAAAAAAGVCAVVVAVLAVRFRSRLTTGLERVSYAAYALPGVVVALSLVFFGIRVAPPLYQTLAMLVFALSLHYLPLAVGAVSSSLLQVPPRMEEAARVLGRGPLEVFRTITAPLVAGGLAAGMALVFLHAMKELPATLLLAPIGFETLATDIWRQTTRGFFEASAIPTIALLAFAAPPLFWMAGRGVAPSS